MAAPLITPVLGKLGRVYYQYEGTRRFASKAAYELQQRRDLRTGRFISKSAAARQQQMEKDLQRYIGRPPPKNSTWVKIATMYPDRFEAKWRTFGAFA